jgi:hypothetical protein
MFCKWSVMPTRLSRVCAAQIGAAQRWRLVTVSQDCHFRPLGRDLAALIYFVDRRVPDQNRVGALVG